VESGEKPVRLPAIASAANLFGTPLVFPSETVTLTDEPIWVVLDNLSSHKVVGVKEAIASAGAKILYFPPYSPDFNPIEHVFSKLKTWVRQAKLRTMEL